MKKRIHQFFSQLFCKMYIEDVKFIKQHLSIPEQKLFFQLNTLNQKHSVNVTYTLLHLCPEASPTLVKAALLHDIGKLHSKLNLLNKTLAVLFHCFFPIRSFSFAKKHPHHFMHYYFFHPQIGGALLENIGTENPIIEIVKQHHQASEDPEILLLQEADEKN